MSNVRILNVPWYLFWNSYSARVEIKDHVSAQSYINVRWEWSYTSPQGRNSYSGFCIFAPADLYNALLTIREERKRKESKSYQRSLMTPALRFAVMKRDHYRWPMRENRGSGRSARSGLHHAGFQRRQKRAGQSLDALLRMQPREGGGAAVRRRGQWPRNLCASKHASRATDRTASRVAQNSVE